MCVCESVYMCIHVWPQTGGAEERTGGDPVLVHTVL